jgi:hypothetical protein
MIQRVILALQVNNASPPHGGKSLQVRLAQPGWNSVPLLSTCYSDSDNSGCLAFHYVALNAEAWDDDVESVQNVNMNAGQVSSGHELDEHQAFHMDAANKNSRESMIPQLMLEFCTTSIHVLFRFRQSWMPGLPLHCVECLPLLYTCCSDSDNSGCLAFHYVALNGCGQ